MADIVELFGAPGTGKSSLVRALDGRTADGRRIAAGQRLLRVGRRDAAATPGAPLAATGAARLVERVLRRERTPAERRSLLAARRTDWADLLAVLRASPFGRDGDDPLATLHAPAWFAATLELRALAESADDGLVVVLDEGFAQRARLVCGDAPDAALLDRYVAAIPAAMLQVHLTASPDVLLDRLGSRARTIDRHAGLDGDALRGATARDAALLVELAERLNDRGDAVMTIPTDTVNADAAADAVVERLERRH